MTIDTKYKKLLIEQTGFLSRAQRTCEEKYVEIEKESSEWQKSSKEAEKELKRYLYSVKPDALHKKIKNLLADRKGSASKENSKWDFDKFVYYIDMINEKNTPSYIVKNNPDYCNAVLSVAVDEYLKLCGAIERTRANQGEIIKRKRESVMLSVKTQVVSKIEAFYKQLESLAEEETECIMRAYSG